ncbi:MAG TPA: AzlC family ABC transporter permease [Trueperaceae bacterium]
MGSIAEQERRAGGQERISGSAAFLEGVRDVAPMMLAVGPFGAVVGLAGVASGLTFSETIAMSALVNGGSAQLAALTLIGSGAPVVVILATVFFVNLRYLMYSMALAPYLTGIRKRWRLLMAQVLFDQTFAFATSRYSTYPGRGRRVAYFFGLALPLFVTWMSGNVVGAAFGAQVPASWSLDFAIPLTFLALLMPAVRDRPAAIAAITGGATALLGLTLPYNLGLVLGAVFGVCAGLAAERRWWS